MLSHWSSRAPHIYCRSLLLIQSNSSVAHSRLIAAPSRDHIPRTPFAPQYMGTWTDRIKRRWQSGDKTKDDEKTEDVSVLLQKKFALSSGGGAKIVISALSIKKKTLNVYGSYTLYI